MDGFLFGKEAGYLTWIHGLRLPFVAKPDRIEEGLQVIHWSENDKTPRKFENSVIGWSVKEKNVQFETRSSPTFLLWIKTFCCFQIKDTKFEHVPVRLYIPLNKETNGPGIVFIHGGGWIVGSVGVKLLFLDVGTTQQTSFQPWDFLCYLKTMLCLQNCLTFSVGNGRENWTWLSFLLSKFGNQENLSTIQRFIKDLSWKHSLYDVFRACLFWPSQAFSRFVLPLDSDTDWLQNIHTQFHLKTVSSLVNIFSTMPKTMTLILTESSLQVCVKKICFVFWHISAENLWSLHESLLIFVFLFIVFHPLFHLIFLAAGSSAGGNLAAAVTLKLRDTKNKIQPKLQLLIYPVTQMLDFNTPSFIKNEMSYLQPKELLVAMVLFYAQGKPYWHPIANVQNKVGYFYVKAKVAAAMVKEISGRFWNRILIKKTHVFFFCSLRFCKTHRRSRKK